MLAHLRLRSMTVTDLARVLDIDKAAVFRHLRDLQRAGEVRAQRQAGRKWVYYEIAGTEGVGAAARDARNA